MSSLNYSRDLRISIVVTIIVALTAACSVVESEDPVPVEEQQSSSPTIVIETPTEVRPSDDLEDIVTPDQPKENLATGIRELDELIAIVLSNDTEEKAAKVQFATAGCSDAMALGGPPNCKEGQEEGTNVDYLPVLGPGEGSPILPENIDEVLDFQVDSLYAVYRRVNSPVTDLYYPPGTYGLVFITNPEGQTTQYILVHANDVGQIVRLDFFPWTPEDIIEREADQLLILPPEERE